MTYRQIRQFRYPLFLAGEKARILELKYFGGLTVDTVRRAHLPSDLAAQAYLAHALTANGTVHSILARRVSDGSRVAEWRTATGFYRGAMDAWQQFPNRTKEPYLGFMRRSEAGLAEAERALPASPSTP